MIDGLIGFAIGAILGAIFHAWFARQEGGLVKDAKAEASKVAADVKAKL